MGAEPLVMAPMQRNRVIGRRYRGAAPADRSGKVPKHDSEERFAELIASFRVADHGAGLGFSAAARACLAGHLGGRWLPSCTSGFLTG